MAVGYRDSIGYRSFTNYEGVEFQYLRPSADSAAGSWTVTPLYQKLDETPYDDGDYITSPANPQAASCKIKVQSGLDPAMSTGHVVRYRYQKNASGGQALSLTVRLMQGNTVIASNTHNNVANGFSQGSFTLSAGEANSITDYTDLYLQFEAQGS